MLNIFMIFSKGLGTHTNGGRARHIPTIAPRELPGHDQNLCCRLALAGSLKAFWQQVECGFLKHDPEKRVPVFGKDHASPIS
jgi:hypothetical protein